MKRVKSGDKLRTQPINTLVDLGNRLLQMPGGLFTAADQAGVTAYGTNLSDTEIPVGSCVAFKDEAANPYPDTPIRQTQGTILQLDEPAEAGADWCIAAQRIPPGLGGLVFISGVVLARVRDETSSDMTVDIDPDSDWWHLKQGASGAGKIVWLDTVSQEAEGSGGYAYRWALVRFPFGGSGGTTLQFVQTTGAGTDGVVAVKNISMKTDPALSPNYELTGAEYSINYFKD